MDTNIKATLINKEEIKNFFQSWGDFTSVCYDSKNAKTENIAKNCLISHHFSGSRWKYIAFKIEHCPRFVIDQAIRHEEGVVKNVQSFRRVNKNNFAYSIPDVIKDNSLLIEKYYYHMLNTIKLYNEIYNYTYHKTLNKGRATEQARYVLPMATHGTFCIAFTIEGLIHFCNLRLCTQTEDKHRELAEQIRNVTLEVLPELQEYLVPQCESLLYCPEIHGCGKYLNKTQTKEILANANKD